MQWVSRLFFTERNLNFNGDFARRGLFLLDLWLFIEALVSTPPSWICNLSCR